VKDLSDELSSDFCHWGKRFRYAPYDPSKGSIDAYINWLDHEAVRLIESQVICLTPYRLNLSRIEKDLPNISKRQKTQFVGRIQSKYSLN
jgi:hypothetical protein